jgi:outer membrane protein assembly factor BamB
VVGTPRFIDLDGPAVLILQQARQGEPATLSALAIPGGETKWECPQVWPWTIRPNAVEQTTPADWPLVQDLDADGQLQIVVPWVERVPGRDPHQLGIQALDGVTGQANWRYAMGDPLTQPRLAIGPDVDGDACREVFVACPMRDPGSRMGGSYLVVVAVSGKTGVPCWRWQQARQFEPLRARIDPLQWWQPGSDGRLQLLVACHGDGPPGSETDRMVALTASTGRLAHVLQYPGAAAPETADLDRDGILDLVIPPDFSRGEGALRVVRGQPPEPWRRLEYGTPAQDLDGDGVLEVLQTLGDVQTTCFSGRDGRRLWEAEGGGHPRSYALPDGDLDGDGTADVLCTGSGGQFEPLRALSGASGAQRWTSSLKIARSEFFNILRLEPIDLDGDQRPEVICIFERELHTIEPGDRQRQRWLAVLSGQNGQVRWQEPLTAPTLWHKLPAAYAFRPAIGDFDRDGIRDLAVWLATPEMKYLLRAFRGSDGKSLWSRPLPILAGKPDWHILAPHRLVAAACDLHGDDRPRVLVEFESSDDGYTPARTEVWALNGADGAVEWRWRGPPKQANAADLSDPTPLTLRLDDHRNVAVLTAAPERDARTELLSVLDARGQTVATARLDSLERRGGYSAKLRVADVDGDGRDELLWIGDGKLHASSGDLAAVRWQWDLPAGRGELVDSPTTSLGEPSTIAVWSGDTVYGLEPATGRLRWRCEGPGPPARQLEAHVLGCPGADGLPLIAFHEIYDPDNYANVSTVCRQALPVDTALVSSRDE